MKQTLPTVLLSLISTLVLAQEPAQKSVTLSIEGGRSFGSPALQKEALIGNGYQLSGDIFVPLLRKGWDGSVKGSGKFALGIIAGGAYQTAKNINPDAASIQEKYKLYNGKLDVAGTQNGSSNSHGFIGFAGLQADFPVGKLTISPSVSGGYFSLTRDGFTQSSQVMVNGNSQTVVLSASAKEKSTGFITIPKLKLGYYLTENLSMYAACALNAGPGINSTKSFLVPSGGFNEKNTYEPMQLTSGKMSLDGGSKDPAHLTTNVSIGFSWGFGKSRARHYKGKIIKTGDNGMMHGKQTQGATFGEKVNQGLHAAGSAVQGGALVAGNPIGGIIVMGGKNPDAGTISFVTNSKGEFEFNAAEDGDYRFAVASPGQPIGGIVVKGGKNPGGSLMTVTTDKDGSFQLNGLSAGNYRFTMTAPTTSPAKSINEKGIK
ncbi:carboxypeptidase-like regulatory domain-containing protein [Flavitalea flava]